MIKVDSVGTSVYKFTLYPDNNKNLWLGFGIAAHDYQPTIEKWIEKNEPKYVGKLKITREKDFARKPTYYICENAKDACDSPILGYSNTVILGNKYSYSMFYPFQDGTYDYSRIEKEIYPNIVIK